MPRFAFPSLFTSTHPPSPAPTEDDGPDYPLYDERINAEIRAASHAKDEKRIRLKRLLTKHVEMDRQIRMQCLGLVQSCARMRVKAVANAKALLQTPLRIDDTQAMATEAVVSEFS